MTEVNLDNFIDSSIRSLPLPKLAEEGLIFAKNYFKEEDNREKVMDFFENIISKGTNFVKDIWDVKDIVKTEGIKEGIGKVVDIAIDNANGNSLISFIENVNNVSFCRFNNVKVVEKMPNALEIRKKLKKHLCFCEPNQ